jgi:transposase InsO family protein
VGYSISDHMTSHLAFQALENAVARRRDVAGCIVHSACHDMVGSMGRVGAAGDNAAMESFFALLQKDVLNTRRCDTEKSCGSRS